MVTHGLAHKRWGFAAAMAIGVLLFSGCAAEPATTPTSTAAPTSDAPAATPEVSSETPDATPAEINLDDPSSWIIDFAGIGPLTMGGDVTAEKQSMTAFTSTAYEECPAVAFFAKSDFPSVVVVTGTESGSIQHIAVTGNELSSSPRTSKGIGIDSSLDDLKAAYPELIDQDVNGRQTYSLKGENGTWINFAAIGETIAHIDVSTSSVVPKEYCA